MYNFTSKIPIIDTKMHYFSNRMQASHGSSCFLCVLNGSLAITLGSRNYTLNKSDVIFLPTETPYTLVSKEPSILMYVCFHPFFLMDTLGARYREILCNSAADTRNDHYKHLNTCLANLAVSSMGNSEEKQCYVYAKAFELLHSVSGYFMPSSPPEEGSKVDVKLRQFITYISSNYMRPVSLSDAAEAMGYTPPYLSNFVRKHLGVNFQDYINSFRLEAALLLIRYSEEALAKIPLLCGFPNSASFTACFRRKYRLSPEEYRNGLDVESLLHFPPELVPITNTSLFKDYLFHYMDGTKDSNSLHETLTVQKEQANVLHRSPLDPYWNMLINIGPASDFDKLVFRNHLAMMQKDLVFQYGRCYGILALARVYQQENEKTYDFSKIFDIIDFLKSIHLKPFFEISNKPFHIYKESEHENPSYDTFLKTKEYDSFLYEILPHFIKACITRYGFDEFTTWKFELWRRYNPTMSSLESPEDYSARFQRTAAILKSLVPNVSLGGPCFNSFLETSDFEQLLAAFHNKDYIPDFVSALYFPYIREKSETDPGKFGYTTAQSPDRMLTKIKEMKEALSRNGFSDLPFYLTELGAYLSNENYINDSTYPAVYILYQILGCYGKVNALGFWVATDVSLEYHNPSEPLFGGNGIISRDGIRKAGYYAFSFLKQLGNQVISYGEHYIVTATEYNTIQILVYYHSNLNQNFAKSPFSQELLLYPYSAFEDISPLDFRLKLTHMTAGTYSIKETTLDLKHGNVLDTWDQLNHIRKIRPSDVEYMKNQCTPSLRIRMEDITDTFTLHTVLNYNEVKLFTFALYR